MTLISKLQLFAVTLVLLVSNAASSQANSDKYYQESAELRASVWAWDRPEFNVRDIPAEYSKASKVVIAHHTELSGDSKSKVKYYGVTFARRKELSIIEIVRVMVKVNDKVAVDYYSELSFSVFEKKRSLYKKDNVTTYVGVRIVKPDGRVREVNADEMVLTRDSRSQKEGKLAIPDLQPGDIVDYFIATDLAMTNDFTSREYSVILFDNAPTMHHSFHAQLGKRFAIDYRSYNGAPDLKVSRNEDDDIVIDVVKKNMAAFETALWIAPAVQLPFIRMNIALGMRKEKPGYSKAGEINKNISPDDVMNDRAYTFGLEIFRSPGLELDEVTKIAKKQAKRTGVDFKKMSEEERAALLYYTLRFTKIMNVDMENMERSIHVGEYTFDGLPTYMYVMMQRAGLKTGLLISSTRTGYRMSEVMDEKDFKNTAFVGDKNQFVNFRSVYDVPFYLPQDIEGMSDTRALRPRTSRKPANDFEDFSEKGPGFNVPVSHDSENAHIENLVVNLVPGETKIDVKRNTTIKGHYKLDVQRALILYEDFYESERKLLGEEMGLLEKLEDTRKGRRYVDEVRNALAEERKKQKDAFVEEAHSWFEQEITDLEDYKVENMGVRHTAPDLVYSSNFKMDGLLKKAGSNIIFEIGKIQASPLTIKPEQRKRDLDVFMNFARSTEFHVEVKVPDGYTAEGIEALNKNVSNELGGFVATASLEGDIIKVNFSRKFTQAYVPAEKWDRLLAFIDAGAEWSNSKILFKKK